MKLKLSVISLTILVLASTCLSSAQTQQPERALQSCEEGQYFATDDNGCHDCSKLIPHCTHCTNEGVCTKCLDSYKLAEVTIKDNTDPENGEKRTIAQCDDLPFFSKWYGIVVILLAPLLVGAAVAITIKLICDSRQKSHDE